MEGLSLQVKCVNSKGEYSVYSAEIGKGAVAGDGLDFFLAETTGVEVDD
jgi:hypothetical protein